MAVRPALLFLFLINFTLVISQTDTIRLDEVSVIPFQESKDRATGGTVSIQVPEMDLQQVLNNAEIINFAPGVFMASGTYNTNRLVIRGIGSRTPYGSNRIRAYLDDIPLTSGDGISTVEDIDAFSINSIDIVKGPSSALYGSGLGGIVKINGRYPETQGFSLSQRNEMGSFSTWKNTVSLAYKQNRFAFMSGYSRSSSTGFRENSQFKRNNIFLNARYFAKRSNIIATLHIIDLYSQIPSSLNLSDFTSAPGKAAGNWLAAEGFEEYLKGFAGISISSVLSKKLQNHLALYSKFGDPYERRPFNVLDERSFSYGFRESLRYRTNRIKISTGVEYYRDHYTWQIYETLDQGHGLLQSDNKEKRQYLNTFFYAQWKPGNKLLVDGGLNINILNYQLEAIFSLDSADNTGSYNYQPVLSPRIGLNYEYLPRHFLYTSIGHGFSAPSLEETLLPEGSVNLELKPESGWNMEIGSRGYLFSEKFLYNLSAYAIYLQNLLVTERLEEDIFTGVNAGTVLNTGLEFLGTYDVLKAIPESKYNLRMICGFTASDNKFLDFIDNGISYNDKQLPGIPSTILHTSIIATAGEFNTHLQYRYTGRQWMDDGNTLSYNQYQVVNFQLGWKHQFKSNSFGIELTAGVKNLFNTAYASMILVNAPSFGGSLPRYYYPGMPRQLHAGIAIRYR